MHADAFDPRAKFLAVMLAVAATFTVNSIWGAGMLASIMLLLALATQTPLRRIGRNIALISWLLLMTGGLRFWGIVSTENAPNAEAALLTALTQSLVAVAQLAIVVGWVSLFNAASSPLEIVTAFEHFLKPFQRVGLPVSNLSTVAMMTLRFLPILWDEAQQLMQTLIARGIDWKAGTWRERATHLVFLCAVLLNSLLRRVEALTVAMENRDFTVGAARTTFHVCRWRLRDHLLVSVCLAGFACCVLIREG